MEHNKQWSSSSNEAVTVVLEHPSDPGLSLHFHPDFTYPIFGDEEAIFGYEDLDIKLIFDADTLTAHVDVNYDSKFEAIADTKPDDIEGKLAPFLPTVYDDEIKQTLRPIERFTPPGQLLHEYEVDGRTFGIWSSSLTDPLAKRLLRHAQILIPMFIEGGTAIELDDPEWTIDRWRIFFIYAIDKDAESNDRYAFAGYSTAYRLFFLDTDRLHDYSLTPAEAHPSAETIANIDFPPVTDTTLQSRMPSRQRISQFLITPPFQNAGHGSHLYSTMLETFLHQPQVKEITVEDPNENFDVLRDVNDLLRLRTDTTWTAQKIESDARLPPSRKERVPMSQILNPEVQSRVVKAARLAPRQLARLSEMQLLANIPPRNRNVARLTRKDKASDAHDRAYFFWRLVVKQRLFKFNREALTQLDPVERVEKLDETVANVEREYDAVLDKVHRRLERAGGAEKGTGAGKKRKLAGKARAVVDVDEEEDAAANGDGAPGGAAAPVRPKKRVRIEDEDDE